MNKILLISTMVVITMGFTMPGCPDQSAQQQKMDEMTAKNLELQRKVGLLESQTHQLESSVTEMASMLGTVNNTVQMHKDLIEKLDASVNKAAAAKTSPASSSKSKSTAKSKAKPAAKPAAKTSSKSKRR